MTMGREFNEKEFRDYAIKEVGYKKGMKVPNYSRNGHFQAAVNAASMLASQYDQGIGIANGGLWLAYVFSLYGLPTVNVDMKRALNGATYKQIEPFGEEEIKEKRVILFDNDVVTGRTLRRAVREICKFKPKGIDLLLVQAYTHLNKTHYKKNKKFFKKDYEPLPDTPKENPYLTYGHLRYDLSCQIPKEIEKVFALDRDFSKKSNIEYLVES